MFLLRFFNTRNSVIIAVLTIALLPSFIIDGGFFPISDTSLQFWSFIVETKRMLSTGAPWWSWNTALGDNFIATHTYYSVTRPLIWLVCLLPYKWLNVGFVALFYSYFLIVGWLASHYLSIMGLDKRLRTVGSLLFTFSSYIIASLEYMMFFDPLIAFLLMMIAAERFLRGRRYALTCLVLASFYVAFTSFYFMVSTLFTVLIYCLFRLGSLPKERRLPVATKAIGCVILGVAMACVALLPMLDYMQGSHRDHASLYANWPNHFKRFVNLFLPQHSDGVRLWEPFDNRYNIVAPNIAVFGLLPMLLFIFKQPKYWLSILCILFLVMYLTPLGGVFSLFIRPDYARWIYTMLLVIILASMLYFKNAQGQRIKSAYTYLYIGFSFAVYAMAFGGNIYTDIKAHNLVNRLMFSALAIGCALSLSMLGLWLTNRQPIGSKRWMRIFIVSISAVTVVQMFCHQLYRCDFGPISVYHNANIKQLIINDDFDASRKFTSRTHFYNVDTYKNIYINAAITRNRPSISCFNSLHNPAANDLFIVTDRIHDPVLIQPDLHLDSYAPLMSVSNVVSFVDTAGIKDVFGPMSFIKSRGNEHEFTLDNYIPMGMAYDKYTLQQPVHTDSIYLLDHDISRAMLNALLIDSVAESALKPYLKRADFCDTIPVSKLVDERRRYVCDSFVGDNRGFKASITLPDTMVMFFSVVADPHFQCLIDDEPAHVHKVNLGLSSIVVPPGRHHINFVYKMPALAIGGCISLLALLIFTSLVVCEYRRQRRNKSSVCHERR